MRDGVKSDVEPIENVDDFVREVLAVRDQPQISDDDDLAPFKFGVVAYVPGKGTQVSPILRGPKMGLLSSVRDDLRSVRIALARSPI